ncbi:TraR/DksA family transcriptional regulator [Desulfovibrio sp. JC010]|uniref:TraR/DksA family transcriptional regulator n=1 Tax=Desulfovibrio sp. JC010 TaxID=2593641 RepID=UPI0013D6322D|nr:TraR/DksA family transcriptional regulator [Desulfovibrio sp. JC010]NDV25091.1 TraR/DksA family transcriptional regulator [Desulfovibrio sp. JC010]
MNSSQRTSIRKHLEEKLAELIQRTQARDTAVESCADDNEYASRISEQKINLALHVREAELITALEETLGRVDHWDFGICEDCGKEIAIARIKANPTTRFCVSCQSRMEEDQLGRVG